MYIKHETLPAVYFLLIKTEYYNISFQIFYKDRHGNAVYEYGRPKSMDYIIDEGRYALETVSSHTQHLHNQP